MDKEPLLKESWQFCRKRKKKPPWLKKAFPDKPWKYKYITEDGLEIEPYNFNTSIGMDCDKIEEACDWIDSINKEK